MKPRGRLKCGHSRIRIPDPTRGLAVEYGSNASRYRHPRSATDRTVPMQRINRCGRSHTLEQGDVCVSAVARGGEAGVRYSPINILVVQLVLLLFNYSFVNALRKLSMHERTRQLARVVALSLLVMGASHGHAWARARCATQRSLDGRTLYRAADANQPRLRMVHPRR